MVQSALANIIHQIDGDDQRQRAVSTADYGSPVPVPDGYAVPTYAPKSNNDGWASTKGCKEPGCNAHWIIGGTGYCIMHSKNKRTQHNPVLIRTTII